VDPRDADVLLDVDFPRDVDGPMADMGSSTLDAGRDVAVVSDANRPDAGAGDPKPRAETPSGCGCGPDPSLVRGNGFAVRRRGPLGARAAPKTSPPHI